MNCQEKSYKIISKWRITPSCIPLSILRQIWLLSPFFPSLYFGYFGFPNLLARTSLVKMYIWYMKMVSKKWCRYLLQLCLFVLSCTSNFSAIWRLSPSNLDLCLALTAFSSKDSFTRHTYCDMGPPFLRSYPKDSWFSLLNAVLFAKEQSLPTCILDVMGLTRSVREGHQLTISRMLSESTVTRLPQPVLFVPYRCNRRGL
jgi:hypothetical protein